MRMEKPIVQKLREVLQSARTAAAAAAFRRRIKLALKVLLDPVQV